MIIRASTLALAATLALSACGPSGSSSSGSAPPPPAPLTPAQAKALVATLPAPFNTGDPEAGKAVFTQCAACHTTAQGGPNLTGPNLWGVFGRPVAHEASYAYSDGLKTQSFIWDAPEIDKWITDPRAVVPTTKMSFAGLKDPKDRINVIAYLKTATSPAP
ncbi:MAG TPA: cytochrome c family protein [Caulobacteraceae bacterium]|nr:cytochrome c family protein [Caulobacteraceae bacterium]